MSGAVTDSRPAGLLLLLCRRRINGSGPGDCFAPPSGPGATSHATPDPALAAPGRRQRVGQLVFFLLVSPQSERWAKPKRSIVVPEVQIFEDAPENTLAKVESLLSFVVGTTL